MQSTKPKGRGGNDRQDSGIQSEGAYMLSPLRGYTLALLTVLKKWTFDLSMTKVALRRQIFEANVNWFTLILQVHGTKPLDDPVQQASVRLG